MVSLVYWELLAWHVVDNIVRTYTRRPNNLYKLAHHIACRNKSPHSILRSNNQGYMVFSVPVLLSLSVSELGASQVRSILHQYGVPHRLQLFSLVYWQLPAWQLVDNIVQTYKRHPNNLHRRVHHI